MISKSLDGGPILDTIPAIFKVRDESLYCNVVPGRAFNTFIVPAALTPVDPNWSATSPMQVQLNVWYAKGQIKKIPVALYLSFLRSKGALYLSFIRIKGYIYVYILHICCWATKYNTIFLRCCYLTNQFVFFASQRRLKIFSTVVIRNSRLSVKFQNCS